MDPRVRWVDENAALASVAIEFGRGPVALDTEADSYHHYRDKVCLIQLSSAGGDVLVDPLSGLELGPLWSKLEDAGIVESVTKAEGFALRLEFGPASMGRIPCRIYACFPDVQRSRIAGELMVTLR